jgi:hypothetical protein
MDTSKLKHNASAIKNKIKTSKEGVVATEDLTILFPKRFLDKDMASIDATVHYPGIAIIVDSDNNYSKMNIPNKLETEASVIEDVTIDGTTYLSITVTKDTFLFTTLSVVQDTDLLFQLLDEFIMKGNIPFYMEYEDVLNIFLNSREYLDNGIADNHIGFSILVSITARDADNNYYRTSDKGVLKYVGLSNPTLGSKHTFTKLTRSHLKKGMVSAINNPEETGTIHNEVYGV